MQPIKDITSMIANKYPNSRIFVISDHHFFHSNILLFGGRQFDSVEEMNSYIIETHNGVVSSDDIVFFLGDFSFKNSAIANINSKLNGHKFLIVGNHDDISPLYNYGVLGFDDIFTVPVRLGDNVLSHYPIVESSDDLSMNLTFKQIMEQKLTNLHGHIHSDTHISDRHINCSCEVLEYKPKYLCSTNNLSYSKPSSKTHFLIEHPNFGDIINGVLNSSAIPANILLSDYLYSLILDIISLYRDQTCVFGSFTHYKKYGFYPASIDDLDISIFDNSVTSKKKLFKLLKSVVDSVIDETQAMKGINLSIIKLFYNMRQVGLLYLGDNKLHCNCILDANCLPTNIYKGEDFQSFSGKTSLELLMNKSGIILPEGFKHPQINANFMTLTADIINVLLQLLYQYQIPKDKQIQLMKKLKLLIKGRENKIDENMLENTMMRFLIRNIQFFYMANRKNEIDFILRKEMTSNDFINMGLSQQIKDIFLCDSSEYNRMLTELRKAGVDEIASIGKAYARELTK